MPSLEHLEIWFLGQNVEQLLNRKSISHFFQFRIWGGATPPRVKKVPVFRTLLCELFSECMILSGNLFPQVCRVIKYASTVVSLFLIYNAIFAEITFFHFFDFGKNSHSWLYALNIFDFIQIWYTYISWQGDLIFWWNFIPWRHWPFLRGGWNFQLFCLLGDFDQTRYVRSLYFCLSICAKKISIFPIFSILRGGDLDFSIFSKLDYRKIFFAYNVQFYE